MSYTVQSDHPVPVVNVIILNDAGELLLLRRTVEPYKGSWTIVGGRIEVQDDCAEAAAVREVKEETGLDVAIIGLAGVGTYGKKNEKTMDPRFFVVKVIYIARVLGGSLQKNVEADEFRWVSPVKAVRERLGLGHADSVRTYLERKDRLIPVDRNRFTEHYGKDFPYTMTAYPRFASLAIILNGKKDILLAHRARNPFSGCWDLPGGHLYVEEAAEDCLRREVKEELGVSCEVGELFGVYSDKGQNPKSADVAAAYFTTIHSERFEKNVEMDDFGYFPLAKLPPYMAYQNRRIVEDVMKRLAYSV